MINKVLLFYCLSVCMIMFPVTNLFPENTGNPEKYLNKNGETIVERFIPPKEYLRNGLDSTTFAFFLRNLPLKPYGSYVKYYNGKINYQANHCSVIDLSTGKKDLQQCADAIMRLRADYLFFSNQHNKINFSFTNGFKAEYIKWKNGFRISVKGNGVTWVKKAGVDDSYDTFLKFMEIVFIYAGTLSLSKELKPVTIENIEIGDIFIQGGSPGHAVIVVDKAINTINGEVIFLLAQGFMPAQDIHVLKNLNNANLSPWYTNRVNNEIITPDWTFTKNDLKRFY